MKSLTKWQFISFFSRILAMGFGLVQSFVILRIFSVEEWGLVQLVVSIGASLGIYQHLGLASASNREIAASKDKNDVFKIMFTSLSIRYVVTSILSIGLFIMAPRISETYKFAEIVLPLRIYALIIFIQGGQSLFNSVISGTKRFKTLFIFQTIIAFVSILIYIPFVYYFGIIGYFYAFLIYEILRTILLFIIALKPYFGNIVLPSKKEFIKIFKNLFSLGMTIYIVKILVINWEKSGTNLLGLIGDAQLLGIFSFSLLYAKKLMHVSDSITDVNLPVFSDKYANDISEFRNMFTKNFNRVFFMLVFFGMSAIIWAQQLIDIIIGSDKYNLALPLILPMVFAFVFFSLLNILESSLTIPAKLKMEMILGFFSLLFFTVVFYFLSNNLLGNLISMSYGMLFGASMSFFVLTLLIQRKLKFNIINMAHILILVQALFISYFSSTYNIIIKAGVYLLMCIFYFLSVYFAKFINKDDINLLVTGSTNFYKKIKNGFTK